MKWIKKREEFLLEVKISEIILPNQKQRVVSLWGREWLDLEKIEPTENIIQGTWKLSYSDKLEVFSDFFQTDLKLVYKTFSDLPDEFIKVANKSIKESSILKESFYKEIFSDFDMKSPTINQMSFLMNSVFRDILVSESKSSNYILRDEDGKPTFDEGGKPIKIQKEEGEIIFSKNLVNINTFIDSFNKVCPDINVDKLFFTEGGVAKVRSFLKDEFNGDYDVEVDPFKRDLFLQIEHNPQDILNISISKFFTSCQNLYSGGHNEKIIGNIFDPNSIPAFLYFDTPIHKGLHKISEKLPLCRLFIRNIEQEYLSEVKLFFDKCYPERMENIMKIMINKYSGNKEWEWKEKPIYNFYPDVPQDFNIVSPYMDRLKIKRGKLIGINSKKVILTGDLSEYRISPKTKIEELIIENPNLPDNFHELKLNPKWIKFRMIDILNFSVLENIKTDSIILDKCKIDSSTINSLSFLKKLQIVSCFIEGDLDLTKITNLEELSLIYTISSDELEPIVSNLKKLKSLTISGDIYIKNRDFCNQLIKNKIKVEVIGPKI